MRPAGWALVERWWNGSFGRSSQRRIWLYTDGETWRVEARQGDGDAPEWHRDLVSELQARLLMRQMRERTGDDWKQLSV